MKNETLQRRINVAGYFAVTLFLLKLINLFLDFSVLKEGAYIAERVLEVLAPVCVAIFCLLNRKSQKIRWWPITVGFSALCLSGLIGYSSAVMSISVGSNGFVLSLFLATTLFNIAGILVVAGSLFDFEYKVLFAAGTALSALSVAASLVITTLYLAFLGAFAEQGLSGINLPKTLEQIIEVLFYISLFILNSKEKKEQ